jgi:hypothetical protein
MFSKTEDAPAVEPKEPNTMDRRTFLKQGAMAGVAVTPIAGLLASASVADGGHIPPGDAAILQFLAAAELIEEDLWQQYAELSEGNPVYKEMLEGLDEAYPNYIGDATADEHSHHAFINAFLSHRNVQPVNLDRFRTLPSVDVEGANQIGRLTNLRALNVDTSWFWRYRGSGNPDFGDSFPQIATIQGRPSVPTSNSMTDDEIKAAAFTAAFHFPTIEQGGTSLYVNMLTKVSHLDTLKVVASIGPVEAIHFSVFQGSLEEMEAFTAPNGQVFPDLANMEETEDVLPVPCTFFNANFPPCSVVRPISDSKAGAMAAVNALKSSNLFQGQSQQFIRELERLAQRADNARRHL